MAATEFVPELLVLVRIKQILILWQQIIFPLVLGSNTQTHPQQESFWARVTQLSMRSATSYILAQTASLALGSMTMPLHSPKHQHARLPDLTMVNGIMRSEK